MFGLTYSAISCFELYFYKLSKIVYENNAALIYILFKI